MTYDQGNDDVIVYNNVLMSVILHFNISTFNIFKLFSVTLHPSIHLL